MALNENIKNLIRSVVSNDMLKAKQYTKAILSKETASTNQYFCKSMMNALESQPNFIELPSDLRGILKMEDVSTSFNKKRYYITDREKEVFNQIDAANNTNKKLKELGIRFLNTTLLYGESGTGKTTFRKICCIRIRLTICLCKFLTMYK